MLALPNHCPSRNLSTANFILPASNFFLVCIDRLNSRLANGGVHRDQYRAVVDHVFHTIDNVRHWTQVLPNADTTAQSSSTEAHRTEAPERGFQLVVLELHPPEFLTTLGFAAEL